MDFLLCAQFTRGLAGVLIDYWTLEVNAQQRLFAIHLQNHHCFHCFSPLFPMLNNVCLQTIYTKLCEFIFFKTAGIIPSFGFWKDSLPLYLLRCQNPLLSLFLNLSNLQLVSSGNRFNCADADTIPSFLFIVAKIHYFLCF